MAPARNPFFNRHRITSPAYFRGRQKELEQLYGAVLTGQCRSIVGERKTGKSSLLTHLSYPETQRRFGLDPDHTLFSIATYKHISFLERAEVERLVREPVAPYGMEYDPLAIATIYEVAAGHPFLTQLVCHEMVVYHNETERSYITVADLDAVLERITERGEAHFKYVWAEADSAERAALLALAELLTHSDGATVEEVIALSERRGRPLERETALQALLRLESRDIVARTAIGSERFRFRVDLVRRWIVRNPQLADTV